MLPLIATAGAVIGWRYWADVPLNTTFHTGPPTVFTDRDWPYIQRGWKTGDLYARHGVFDVPIYPVTVAENGLIEVVRAVVPDEFASMDATWSADFAGWETRIVWFFHSPGSGVWINISGRPVIQAIGTVEDFAAVRRIVTNHTVFIRYPAWYNCGTEIVMQTDDVAAPVAPTACPNVPFTCQCIAPYNFAQCNGSLHLPSNRGILPSAIPKTCLYQHAVGYSLIVATAIALATWLTSIGSPNSRAIATTSRRPCW